MPLARRLRFTLPAIAAIIASASQAADHDEPNYGDDLRFLKAHTEVLELSDGQARVAICPQWQGRVLTSTCQGPGGSSFGWINRAFITAGEASKVFNNYGGEDRFWISPEAGQFAIFFPPAAEQKLANWMTQPGLNEGAFQAVADPATKGYRLSRRLQLTNYSNTKFDLEVQRNIALLAPADYPKLFGPQAARLLDDPGLKRVGFASDNTIINRGKPMTRETGLISIWTLGQFKPGPHTVIVIPYAPGDQQKLGPPVTPDYFGPVPEERLRVTESAILFLGDGHFRAKLGVSPRRTKALAGSYNFDQNVLTIVSFSLPKDAANRMYVDNRWQLPLAEPYRGDAFNSYNDGPAEPGAETLGGFYELETLSPALELATGETLRHQHRTMHVVGDKEALAKVARSILGVDLAEVRRAMFP